MITRVQPRLRLTPGLGVLIALSALAFVLIVYRFAFGLGAVTNLSDGYPWGFWIGIDVLAGIALASGGFVMAGLVHLFGGRRFHPLARPAILTALLGYLMFIAALTVDLGRPWHIWKAVLSWNHVSPMFEVAWCVMLYTLVLMLEFTPAVLERFALRRVQAVWRAGVPWIILGLLPLFTFAMTNSVAWAAVVLLILGSWEVLARLGVVPGEKQMPMLLIMAGVLLSTMHQSSLGTLFLIIDKLHPLWYTPILPVLFFLSAVMVAPAMVIVESTTAARVLGRRFEKGLLLPLGRAMPYIIGVYLVLRVGDMVGRGVVLHTMILSGGSVWWWLEIGLLLAALAHFWTPEVVVRGRGLLVGSYLTVLGVVVNRVGVAMVGMDVPEYGAYVPAWSEVAITVGILSFGLLCFRLATALLPVYEGETAPLARPKTAQEPYAATVPVRS